MLTIQWYSKFAAFAIKERKYSVWATFKLKKTGSR